MREWMLNCSFEVEICFSILRTTVGFQCKNLSKMIKTDKIFYEFNWNWEFSWFLFQNSCSKIIPIILGEWWCVHLCYCQTLNLCFMKVYNDMCRVFPRRFVLPLNITNDTPVDQNLNTRPNSTATAMKITNDKVLCLQLCSLSNILVS